MPRKLKVTFRIHKNCENGQSITLAADDKNHHICPVHAAYQIYLRAKRLGQSDDQPMGVFVNHQGIVRYLTANKIAEVLQSVAKTCHPDLTRDEIMHFSSHLIRVWAVVLLDEAGMNPGFIKSRLRWMGDSCCTCKTPRYSRVNILLLLSVPQMILWHSLAKIELFYWTSYL